MVALVLSTLIGLLGLFAVMAYGKRRAPGARLTWGEAMAASTFAFFMFFWWYGVIPHQWLTYADKELLWASNQLLAGPGSGTAEWLRLTINKEHIRDLVAVLIYVVGLGLHIFIWAYWSDRKKRAEAAAAVVPTSRYGRPLVRKG